jgi:hypothetical protein
MASNPMHAQDQRERESRNYFEETKGSSRRLLKHGLLSPFSLLSFLASRSKHENASEGFEFIFLLID